MTVPFGPQPDTSTLVVKLGNNIMNSNRYCGMTVALNLSQRIK